MSEEAFPASARIVDALEKAPGSGEPSDSPFSLAFGMTFFERKVAQSETQQRFGLAMSSWSEGDGATQLRHCYGWASLPKGAKVVDVWVAVEHISLAIAAGSLGLEFVVEDLSPLAGQAGELIASFLEKVARRFTFLGHDFFQAQRRSRGARMSISCGICCMIGPDISAARILGNVPGAMRWIVSS
ncbi:hypothetical protein BDV12DRAFT_28999 [Aspergillus spectabilis]